MILNRLPWIKEYSTAIITFLCVVLLFIAFKGGEMVGTRKAHFSYRWAENYHRNFGGPKEGFFPGFFSRESFNTHGAFGTIIKIDTNAIIIKNQQNRETIIIINDNTAIDRSRQTVKVSDLKSGDKITVIGSPNEQGQIEAKFIRVFPN